MSIINWMDLEEYSSEQTSTILAIAKNVFYFQQITLQKL